MAKKGAPPCVSPALSCADPEVRARMVAGLKRAWADPEVRARRVAGMKRALAERGVALPEMTGEQRNLYRKLHPLVGREAALAEVFREAAPDEDDLAPDDRREIA